MRVSPPAYPFINQIFKERGHKTISTPETLAYLPSCLQMVTAAFHRHFQSGTPAHTPTSRFGEGVFTETEPSPQEQKRVLCEFFAALRRYRKIW
jgi:hypothetical protein